MERTDREHKATIRQISSHETYPVRHPVLRTGKALEACVFEGDDDVTTVHFGLFEDETLCGVVSVFKNDSTLFFDENQLQLRGMAVLETRRGKGYGEKLLRHAETFASEKRATLLWFNARIVAVPFYEKCGYKKIGDGFNIGDIGMHYVMFKFAPDFGTKK